MGFFDTSLGALLIGIFFNTYLYGIVTYQYASYHNTKFNDPLWIRVLVFCLFLLDSFHSASVIYMAWVYSVENYVNPLALLNPVWPYPFTVVATSVTAFLTQAFLGYRILRLTKSMLVYYAVLFLSTATLVIGVVCGVLVWRVKYLSQVVAVRPIVTTWLCLEVGVDSTITGILTYVLSGSRTGFHNSDTVINRLIRASIQTGLFSGIFSILSLVFFLKSPMTHFFGTFGIPISRVYTNTLMDTLLARHELRGLFKGTRETRQSDAIWIVHDTQAITMRNRQASHNSIQLHIRKEIYTDAQIGNDEGTSAPSPDSSKKLLGSRASPGTHVSEFSKHEKALSI
ncbi:hypothetical protein BDZ94DRAFT_1259866 [Collybia nuda]|uniref:DUF6534 domain-containing protein n=1 Tax=Collybia nuda TaxID=64659 RepID=A0A9P5Y5E0_9AGAR|nr:hypothetical protein BDZ94DRAFT_1259866 [Collybia nuda]